MVTDFQILDQIIDKLKKNKSPQNVSLKVVVFDEKDYAYAKKIHHRYWEIPFYLQVGNDDTTTTNDQELITHLLQKYHHLIEKVMLDSELNDVKVLPQLHTLLWGNKRGV